jgi:Holliday junction DNA helicase RuvA
MSSFYNLPALGEPVTLLTHFVVREDAQLLFGFLTAAERSTFRELVKISGVGPRTALADPVGPVGGRAGAGGGGAGGGRLVKVPGIGKKTAERLLLELKGKLGPDLAARRPRPRPQRRQADIVQALLALGYNEREAQAALKALPPGRRRQAEGIKQALKRARAGARKAQGPGRDPDQPREERRALHRRDPPPVARWSRRSCTRRWRTTRSTS